MKPTADSIAASIRAAEGRGLPPVHKWTPEHTHDIDMRIDRDGTWHYQGTPINRPELVRLFSTILKREGDDYFLVTPVEKARITVEDAPFVAVDFDATGEGQDQILTFLTNVGDRAEAGPDHPIRVARDSPDGEPAPYVEIRDGLEALIDRKSFYRLVENGAHERHSAEEWFGVWSAGVFFPFILSRDLPSD